MIIDKPSIINITKNEDGEINITVKELEEETTSTSNKTKFQFNKQSKPTPVQELNNWYNNIEHNSKIDRFYSYWKKRLNEKGWKGDFNLNDLIDKFCK